MPIARNLNWKWLVPAFLAIAVVTSSCGGATGSTGFTGTTSGNDNYIVSSDLGPQISPIGIDDGGRIAANSASGPVIIFNGVSQAIPTPPNNGVPTIVAMNAGGTVLVTTTLSGAPADSYLLNGATYTLLKRTVSSGKLSQAVALSNNGQVVGTGSVLWTTASTASIFNSPTGFKPLCINNSAVIVGTNGSGEYFKVQNGAATDLHVATAPGVTFGGTFAVATINDSGEIAVQSGDSFDVIPAEGSATVGAYGVILGTMNAAGALPATNGPSPTWPQPSGATVFNTANSTNIQFNAYRSPSDTSTLYYQATGINNSKVVVGTYFPSGNTTLSHGFVATLPARSWGPGSVTVAVSPKSPSLEGGGVQKFIAHVSGVSSQAVTWSVDEAGGGSVDATGSYTAPLNTGTYHVRATSNVDSSAFDEATVTVQSVGGQNGATYNTPVAVAGPATAFQISQVLPTGEMVGFTKPASGLSQPLYWSSATATPTAVPLDTYQGAKLQSLAKVGTNIEIVGTALFTDNQGDHAVPAIWPSPTSGPQKLTSNADQAGLFGSINTNAQILFGNSYWSSPSATGTKLSGFPDNSLSQPNMLANSGVIGLLGPNPVVYTSPTDSPLALFSSGAAVGNAMNAVGAVVGQDQISNALRGVFWSPLDNFAAEHVLPSTANAQATAAYGIGNNGWIVGGVSYADGTGGAPLWVDANHVVDLRAQIPQGTGWSLSQGLWVETDGSIIAFGKSPSGTTGYVYLKAK
ncbi:MAG TPA: hypothetical protein VG944_08285 [Fimbriimonas sp.]|nr:hypothetical protein [Fimbriimonas sp.]